jgi:hypothetical protein
MRMATVIVAATSRYQEARNGRVLHDILPPAREKDFQLPVTAEGQVVNCFDK